MRTKITKKIPLFFQTACPTKPAAVPFWPSLQKGVQSDVNISIDASNVPAQADNSKSLLAQQYTGITAHLQVIKQWIEL